jgi:hypothetical protein
VAADLRLTIERHFRIQLLELDFPVKICVAYFPGQFSSAQLTESTVSRVERPADRAVESTRDLKSDEITEFYLADLNPFVRSLRVSLITYSDIAVFDYNRHLHDAARQLTMSSLATDGLHIPVEDLIHGWRRLGRLH